MSANSVRDVPLPAFLVDALPEYIAAHPLRADAPAALPARQRGGHGTNRGALVWGGQISIGHIYGTHIIPALDRLGIPRTRWHDLRDFYASVCAANGIDIYDVSLWLGYNDFSVTQNTYTHLFKRSHSDAMSKLDTATAVAPAKSMQGIG